MDPLPTNDQGVTPTPSSPERVDGISTGPTAATPPLDVVPVRQNKGGLSALMIVLIVVIILGCVGLGGAGIVGGVAVLGGFFFMSAPVNKPMVAPSRVEEMPTTKAPKQDAPQQPIAPPENPNRPNDKK